MAKLDVDTQKMRECGNEIMKLSISIGDDINKLFDRIQKMPTNTCEWVGESAEAYVSRAKNEKLQYLQFKDVLYSYGKYLVNSADILEQSVRGVEA